MKYIGNNKNGKAYFGPSFVSESGLYENINGDSKRSHKVLARRKFNINDVVVPSWEKMDPNVKSLFNLDIKNN